MGGRVGPQGRSQVSSPTLSEVKHMSGGGFKAFGPSFDVERRSYAIGDDSGTAKRGVDCAAERGAGAVWTI